MNTIKVYHKGKIEEVPDHYPFGFKEGDRVITYNLPRRVDGKLNPYYNQEGTIESVEFFEANVTIDGFKASSGFLKENLIRIPKTAN